MKFAPCVTRIPRHGEARDRRKKRQKRHQRTISFVLYMGNVKLIGDCDKVRQKKEKDMLCEQEREIMSDDCTAAVKSWTFPSKEKRLGQSQCSKADVRRCMAQCIHLHEPDSCFRHIQQYIEYNVSFVPF